MLSILTKRINQFAPFFMTLGLVSWAEVLFAVQWSTSYCTNQHDGPAYTALGFPLPYLKFSGVSSQEFLFMPHAYIFNILALCAVVFFFSRVVMGWLGSVQRKPRVILGSVGIALFSAVAVAVIFQIQAGIYIPVRSIGSSYGPYSEQRPVKVSFGYVRNGQCIPSQFWFPNGWQHK